MGKITKKQYEARQEEIQLKIDTLKNLLNSIPLETENIPQNIIDLTGELWNSTHDEIEQLQKEMKFLNDEWDRRDWNTQEHYMYSLMTNNID